jgi:subtilisin family serine protease
MNRAAESRSIVARISAVALALALSISVANVATAAGRPHQTADMSAEVIAALNVAGPHDHVTVVVRLRSQASLTPRAGGHRERQRALITELRTVATRGQSGLRGFLDRGRVSGSVVSYDPLWITDAIVVTATPAAIAAIALRADVAQITLDTTDIVSTSVPAAPAEPNVAQISAPTMWNRGFTGQGVVVASLDTGVDATHPDLVGTYRGGANSWFDAYGQHAAPFDGSGHGTSTMGVIVGGGNGGTTIGVAPDATWISARIFDDSGTATVSAIHAALQWVLDPDGDPATADSPAIVNNSWAFGTPGCNLEFQSDLQALRAADIIPVFAAGNYGSSSATSVSPANYPEALSVGAIDSRNRIWSGSSRGPAACGAPSSFYPDVVAPGVNIWSTDRNGLYSYSSGTSLAAPAVTGALALLLSSQLASASATEAALLSTAIDVGTTGPDNTFGRGRIDVDRAFAALPSSSTTTTTVPPTSTTTATTEPPTTSTSTTSTTTTSTTTTVPPTTTTTTSTTTTLPPTTTTTTTTTTTVPPTTSTTTTTVPPTTTTTTPPTTTPPTTTTTTLPPVPGLGFSDGFESGTSAAWAATSSNGGRLSVTTDAALSGSYGLAALLQNRTDMYVATTMSASSYHARFQFDPNTSVIPATKTEVILQGLDTGGAPDLTVQVRAAAGGYEIRAGATKNSGTIVYTSWAALSDQSHSIEVGWSAATSTSATDGSIRLWIDGSVGPSNTNVANGARRLGQIRLGPQTIAKGTTGRQFFDGFASSSGAYIGS